MQTDETILPRPGQKQIQTGQPLFKMRITAYIQAITGQNNLNNLNNLIIPEHTDQCRFCEEGETFAHLVG